MTVRPTENKGCTIMEFNQSILFPARSPAMTFAGLQRADSTFSEEFCMCEVRFMMAEPESEEPDYCFSGGKHHFCSKSLRTEKAKKDVICITCSP